jgi:hypothetical protein
MEEKVFRCKNVRSKKHGVMEPCNRFLFGLSKAGITVTCPDCKTKHIFEFGSGNLFKLIGMANKTLIT